MDSLLFVVAMLCQLNVQLMVGMDDISTIEIKQLQCQKYYAECLEINTVFNDHTLAKCIVRK